MCVLCGVLVRLHQDKGSKCIILPFGWGAAFALVVYPCVVEQVGFGVEDLSQIDGHGIVLLLCEERYVLEWTSVYRLLCLLCNLPEI